jgi:uncharacterized protein
MHFYCYWISNCDEIPRFGAVAMTINLSKFGFSTPQSEEWGAGAYKSTAISLNGSVVCRRAYLADSFLSRARGLLFYRPLREHEGLFITKCSSIHSIGMTYPIDAIFVDSTLVILKVVQSVKPLRFRFCRGAFGVLEVRSGTAAPLDLKKGDRISFETISDKAVCTYQTKGV